MVTILYENSIVSTTAVAVVTSSAARINYNIIILVVGGTDGIFFVKTIPLVVGGQAGDTEYRGFGTRFRVICSSRKSINNAGRVSAGLEDWSK